MFVNVLRLMFKCLGHSLDGGCVKAVLNTWAAAGDKDCRQEEIAAHVRGRQQQGIMALTGLLESGCRTAQNGLPGSSGAPHRHTGPWHAPGMPQTNQSTAQLRQARPR